MKANGKKVNILGIPSFGHVRPGPPGDTAMRSVCSRYIAIFSGEIYNIFLLKKELVDVRGCEFTRLISPLFMLSQFHITCVSEKSLNGCIVVARCEC